MPEQYILYSLFSGWDEYHCSYHLF